MLPVPGEATRDSAINDMCGARRPRVRASSTRKSSRSSQIVASCPGEHIKQQVVGSGRAAESWPR